MPDKYPLKKMLSLIEAAIKPFPKAAMFELQDSGYTTLFEQLVSCVISIRTMDETTIPVSLKLFERARTADAMLGLSHGELADLLHGSTFPGQKAATILAIAQADKNGLLTPDFLTLTAIKGVGPKCANLALGVASGTAAISVDIHVHRVVNRWGMVQAATPEKTLKELETLVPQSLWIDINRLLMPFGKHICVGISPWCSKCPVYEWCDRVGVTKHR